MSCFGTATVNFRKGLNYISLVLSIKIAFRDEIGECMEKAYDRLAVEEAAHLLCFINGPSSTAEVMAYAKKVFLFHIDC